MNQEAEEEPLLLQQPPHIMNSCSSFNEPASTTDRLSHLCLTNSPTPCTTCGCPSTFTSSTSSASHKRPSSENPTIQPFPKKPNNTHSLYGFSKIPLSPPPFSFLRRCSSDPVNLPLPPVAQEPPRSPPPPAPNADMLCPATPLSSAVASAKLPPRPRPPTLRRSVSDPMPSPAKTVNSSCESPHAQWLRKMRDCLMEMGRKWEELFAFADDSPSEETKNDNCNSNDASVDNSEGEYMEAVSVEKAGECSIIQFKCPCGKCYKILLYGGDCFYKLM